MSQSLQIPITDKISLSAVHATPNDPRAVDVNYRLVVVIQGLYRDDSLYNDLEFLLVDKGFHTLRFDLLGSGDSHADDQDFTLRNAKLSMDAVKDWAQARGYRELIFISEGVGSIIATLNLALNVKCQVMLWPGLDPQYLADKIFKGQKIAKELMSVNLKADLKNVSMPVLMMHGSADDQYPIDHLNIARKHISSKRMEITSFHGGTHGLPDLAHRKSMFFHMTQFLEKFA